MKALAHTWLGACYAVLLEGKRDRPHPRASRLFRFVDRDGGGAAAGRGIQHDAARIGSAAAWGCISTTKLENCTFCLTVSEYNRRYILEHYPTVDAAKVVVARLGVEIADRGRTSGSVRRLRRRAPLQAPGGGAAACGERSCVFGGGLRPTYAREMWISSASIAGEGPERRNLESLIRECESGRSEVTLLGHVARERDRLRYTTEPMWSC